MFAYVRFLYDNERTIVPVSDIKHFKPKNEEDFEATKAYMVKWHNPNEAAEDCGSYKAQIIRLGPTVDALKSRLGESRVKFPKIWDTSVEESSSEDENDENDSIKEDEKEEVNRERKADSEVEDVKEMYKLLEDEYKQCRELNRNLQKVLIDSVSPKSSHKGKATPKSSPPKVGSSSKASSEVTAVSPNTPKCPIDTNELIVEEDEVQEGEDEGPLYSEQDGKIAIGGGIKLKKEQWEVLGCQKKPSLFVKNLAVSVWGSDVLRNRSVDGKICPRYKTAPRKPLTPTKIDAVRKCFRRHMQQQGLSDEELKTEEGKMKKYINEKIQDINRSFRKQKVPSSS
ncbi:BEN domain-containing protein 5 [Holothuria leucospilota]|uniref:BEN domain-containing protein 5 n=1 Tax=Holothuria leucospilota TaxID=206669 RepID=A0A9Q1CQS8_HOLLE|nr:BEN domain-containing protein 5 [Holothuria leucospilota]